MPAKLKKDRYRVVMFLDDIKITGYIHIITNSRLTDVLNSNQMKEFIPITDADIEVYKFNQTQHLDLIEVNKNKIKVMYPEDKG